METIIDKLKKLAALAQRGEYGEADNARRLLEKQLQKYGLTMDDLENADRKERVFDYKTKYEFNLYLAVFVHALGSKSYALKNGKYNANTKHFWLQLTDLEFADVCDQLDFYCKQFKKERKQIMDNLIGAFCIKQDLFDPDASKDMDDLTDDRLELLREQLKIARAMSGEHYTPRSGRLEKQQLRLTRK